MNKEEIRNIVLNTSNSLYLNKGSYVSENTIDEELREDAEELLACKNLVHEALRIPTFYMNCLYGLTKCVNSSLEAVDNLLGTDKQDDIKNIVENLVESYPKAKALNEERYELSDPDNISKSFKSIREMVENYDYDSKNIVCSYLENTLSSYITKLNSIVEKYTSEEMKSKLDETYKALRENKISSIVEHDIDHFVNETVYKINNTMKEDIYYISNLIESNHVGLEPNDGEGTDDIDVEKESIESIFGESFYTEDK